MRLRLGILGALALVSAGCASDPQPEPRSEAQPPHAYARACPPLFVSPAGEPFRSTPDATVCPIAVWFARADANHDGAIDKAEFNTDAMAFFATLDLNGDDVVDGLEVQRYERQVFPELSAAAGRSQAALSTAPRLMPAALLLPQDMPGGGGGGMGGMGGRGGGGGRHGGGGHHGGERPGGGAPSGGDLVGRFGLIDEPEPVTGADLDFDGRVIDKEFSTRADQRFAVLDTTGTGKLTLPQLAARLPRGGGGPPPSS